VRFSHEHMVLIVDKRPVRASNDLESVRQSENRSSTPAAGITIQDRGGYPPSGGELATGLAVELSLASPISLPRVIPWCPSYHQLASVQRYPYRLPRLARIWGV
jgi:hypothetical protein